jgi:hypothetical protein
MLFAGVDGVFLATCVGLVLVCNASTAWSNITLVILTYLRSNLYLNFTKLGVHFKYVALTVGVVDVAGTVVLVERLVVVLMH